MVESIIVLFFLCVIFFLVFDYARLLICHTTLDYAAARAARARAVGFNDFMILKTARLGAMAVSGECLTRVNGDSAPSTAALVSRMGSYLQAPSPAETAGILDFELWRNGTPNPVVFPDEPRSMTATRDVSHRRWLERQGK